MNLCRIAVNGWLEKKYIDIYEGWRLIDKSAGIEEDLVGLSLFCKKNIPPASNIFFFTDYDFFNKYGNQKDYLFKYFPHRLRFYLYPIKVWWPKIKHKDLAKDWPKLKVKAKTRILNDIDYVAGFKLKEELFPGFEDFLKMKSFSILKKM